GARTRRPTRGRARATRGLGRGRWGTSGGPVRSRESGREPRRRAMATSAAFPAGLYSITSTGVGQHRRNNCVDFLRGFSGSAFLAPRFTPPGRVPVPRRAPLPAPEGASSLVGSDAWARAPRPGHAGHLDRVGRAGG